jgi:hypothetical protein
MLHIKLQATCIGQQFSLYPSLDHSSQPKPAENKRIANRSQFFFSPKFSFQVCACVCARLDVCVCVRERERERERETILKSSRMSARFSISRGSLGLSFFFPLPTTAVSLDNLVEIKMRAGYRAPM